MRPRLDRAGGHYEPCAVWLLSFFHYMETVVCKEGRSRGGGCFGRSDFGESDFSRSFISGFGLRPSRCGPRSSLKRRSRDIPCGATIGMEGQRQSGWLFSGRGEWLIVAARRSLICLKAYAL